MQPTKPVTDLQRTPAEKRAEIPPRGAHE
jgi:hypothetical protein